MDDYETGKPLATPHIEIEDDIETIDGKRQLIARINSTTFQKAIQKINLIPLIYNEDFSKERGYKIYGVIGRIIPKSADWTVGYITPALSRTLLGMISKEDLKQYLPKVNKCFDYWYEDERKKREEHNSSHSHSSCHQCW
ncbi:MAG: hypothetical protein PHQ66_01505 [Candidatus Nanoarchaeia archaeon]|nr:hypothetical protein [Candidatus Nanoarchaeia archaeon]MDD5357948.1 hypothetical protein [Candidatus Nanoarchaeia archaeon]MDD5588867.1 hypothetical protein [Candidatus Nanoarchaeia archaeon]